MNPIVDEEVEEASESTEDDDDGATFGRRDSDSVSLSVSLGW